MDTTKHNSNLLDLETAVDDLISMFNNGGPATRERIVFSLAERAKLAEGKVQKIARGKWNIFGGLLEMFEDDELDGITARIMKRAEKLKTKPK
jgi:hypothetical protein